MVKVAGNAPSENTKDDGDGFGRASPARLLLEYVEAEDEEEEEEEAKEEKEVDEDVFSNLGRNSGMRGISANIPPGLRVAFALRSLNQ